MIGGALYNSVKLTCDVYYAGCIDAALNVISNLEKTIPGLVMATMRHISIERRRGNLDAVDAQYRKYIDDSDSTEVCSFYSIKYARYLAKVSVCVVNNMTL